MDLRMILILWILNGLCRSRIWMFIFLEILETITAPELMEQLPIILIGSLTEDCCLVDL